MKFGTNELFVASVAALLGTQAFGDNLREAVVRDSAIRAGLVPAAETVVQTDDALVAVGKELFESKLLSSSEDTACASCHLDRFGSADGIPVALGTDASGAGLDRIVGGGDIIPRNTLPFWGRGGKGFTTFFSDGRVDASVTPLISQFGEMPPSEDPLIVAIHLPPVEIGEMVLDASSADDLQTETLQSAIKIYDLVARRVQEDSELSSRLSAARSVPVDDLTYLDVASAIANFIRFNFALKDTKFHRFVFSGGDLTDEELNGALLFYGRGRCSSCHNGPYFSDLEFHAIPFPQFGSGKNGFGVDYGRYNVTMNPADLFTFRTPPLFNVSKTAPYSHSGSVASLQEAIRYHVDPLAHFDASMSANDRAQYYQRLTFWAETGLSGVVLSDADYADIESFLGTLSFESELQVKEVDLVD